MAQIRRILHPEEGYYSPAPSDCSQSCNNTLFCNSCLSPTSIPDGFIPKTPFLPPPSAPFVDVNVTAPFVSHKATGHLTLTALVIASVLAAFFLLITYYLLILRYRSYLRRQRAAAALNTPRGPDPSPEEDEDEDAPFNQDGGAAVHHVWFIRTVGLEQPMIDSITVCPYRRGDGLIESTDCSVCLSEFEDGELVRLLPKCCHAFHLPCIDTWLRSHLNCPLCRAPIVSPAFPPAATVEAAATSAVTVAATVPAGNPDSAVPIGVALVSESTDADSSDDSSDGQQTPTALGMIFAVPEEREESGIIGDSSSGNGNNPPAPPVASLSVAEFGFRVQSDLGGFGGRRQLGNDEEEWVTVDLGSDREIQPYRRSVSMDISALGALFHREEDEEGHSEGAVTSCKAKLPPYLREVLPATPAGLRMMKQGRDPKGGNLLQKEAFGVERCSSANSGGYIFSRLGRGRSRSHASILPL